MTVLWNDFFKKISNEKDIIQQLIEIDNSVQKTHYTYDNFILNIQKAFTAKSVPFKINQDTLFITDGEIYYTLEILKRINTSEYKYIIFINQGFIALNKWLIQTFQDVCLDPINIKLDLNINYNQYINQANYKVIPLGEDKLVQTVKEDFSN